MGVQNCVMAKVEDVLGHPPPLTNAPADHVLTVEKYLYPTRHTNAPPSTPGHAAIFNGFAFHHEMMGCILTWVQYHNWTVTLYTNTTNDYGWYKWYAKMFDSLCKQDTNQLDIRPPSTFPGEADQYDLIFLPTDDDFHFADSWLDIGSVRTKIIKINHVNYDRRTAIKNYINVRPYRDQPDAYNGLPCYTSHRLFVEHHQLRDDLIHIFVGDGPVARYDMTTLEALSLQPNVQLHFVGRSGGHQDLIEQANSRRPPHSYHQSYRTIDTESMVELMRKCHYFYYGLQRGNVFNSIKVSGHMAMAFSCGTRTIMGRRTHKYYNFWSTLIYNRTADLFPLLPPTEAETARVVSEGNIQIAKFDNAVRCQFPHLKGMFQPVHPFYQSGKSSRDHESVIPTMIHIVAAQDGYSSAELEPAVKRSWFSRYPRSQITLWTRDRVYEFLQLHYPSHITVLGKLNMEALEAVVRVLVVSKLGGIGVSRHSICRRPVGDIMLEVPLYLASHDVVDKDKHTGILVDFFAAAPNMGEMTKWSDELLTMVAADPTLRVADIEMAWAHFHFTSFSNTKLQNSCMLNNYVTCRRLTNECSTAFPGLTYTKYSAAPATSPFFVFTISLIVALFITIIVISLLRRNRRRLIAAR